MDFVVIAVIVAYFAIVIGIGYYFYHRSSNLSDYILGGRTLNPYVTALSAQASDMSSWLLMGLPGAQLSDIKTVYSHPQSLMQSARFLTLLKKIIRQTIHR